MKYRYMLALFFLFTFRVSLFAQDIDSAALPQDKIIAIVNSEIITQSEVEELLAAFYLQMPSDYSEERKAEELKRMQLTALDRLIEDKLILAEARKQKINIPPEMVEQRLSRIKKDFKDESEFNDALLKQGITPSDFKKRIEEQMMMSAVVEVNVKKNIVVTPVEVTAYYQAHLDEFKEPETAEIDSILCESEKQAEEAYSALKKGESFGGVKERFSQDVALDKVRRGELMPEIEDAVFSLDEGNFSGIVKTEAGFYIFKLLKKAPRTQLPLSSVEAQIKHRVSRKKMDRYFKKWIDDIKKGAYIVIR